MRSLVNRQRTVLAAAVAASLLLVTAACGTPTAGENPAGGTGSLGGLTLAQGSVLLSDGTKVVTIGDQKVTFPTTVTDATWSPDGSRIAFVDGDGNIATARPDGSGVVVLTKAASGVTRSRPSWSRAWLFYAEQKPDGTSTLKSVPTNGCDGPQEVADGEDWSMDTGDGTSYVDLAPSASIGTRPSRVAFQHNEPSGPEIWINDTNQRSPSTEKLVAGSEPALLPDGKKLAYVGTNGQVFVLDLANLSNVGTGQQITHGADHPTRLAWTPDGQHVAYRTPAGVRSVGLSGNDQETSVAGNGVPAFLGAPRDKVGRVTGADPIALSIAATQARWPSVSEFVLAQGYQGAWNAILATPDQAASLANVQSARALLLTPGDTLDPRTKAELQRMFGKIDKDRGGQPDIFLVGNNVSPAVASAVAAMGFKVTRGPLTDTPAPPAGSGACAPQGGGGLFNQTLVVVDGSVAMDNAIATSLADDWNAPIIRIDPKAGLTDPVRAYLARTSGSIESVLLVDAAGAIPADLERQIGELVSGPLGYTTASNPTVPALS